jgi:hypothetical protein
VHGVVSKHAPSIACYHKERPVIVKPGAVGDDRQPGLLLGVARRLDIGGTRTHRRFDDPDRFVRFRHAKNCTPTEDFQAIPENTHSVLLRSSYYVRTSRSETGGYAFFPHRFAAALAAIWGRFFGPSNRPPPFNPHSRPKSYVVGWPHFLNLELLRLAVEGQGARHSWLRQQDASVDEKAPDTGEVFGGILDRPDSEKTMATDKGG